MRNMQIGVSVCTCMYMKMGLEQFRLFHCLPLIECLIECMLCIYVHAPAQYTNTHAGTNKYTHVTYIFAGIQRLSTWRSCWEQRERERERGGGAKSAFLCF